MRQGWSVVKNDDFSGMVQELKSSPLKMGFFIFLVLGGLLAVFSKSLPKEDYIDISYSDMMQRIYLAGLTTAQEQQSKSSYLGKYVRWRGEVVDVEKTWRGYTVKIGDDSTWDTDIILQGVPEGDAAGLSRRQEIQFSGQIDSIEDGRITGYVYLVDGRIQ